MTRTVTSRTRIESRHRARPQRPFTVPQLPVLCVIVLAAVSGGCAPDPDDSGRVEAPREFVSSIEGVEGPLWLGAPPSALMIDDEVVDEIARGVVALRASGCGPVSNGTAFAIAPGLLIGAAHVIAGASSIEIEWPTSASGEQHTYPVEVVAYREERDLALLRTDAAVTPLNIDRARLGAAGAIVGFPEGSALEASPARIEHYVSASGLWGDETRRRVYVLAADVRAGQSGAPLLDQRGSVVGIAFATVQGPSDVGFALSRDELVGFLVVSDIDARIDYLGRTVIKAQAEDLHVVPNGTCELR